MNMENLTYYGMQVDNASVPKDAWRVGVYCRLSKDDELQGESASISNQRDYLLGFCKQQGWEVVKVFQDDGFTGLNMERPGLQELLKAVENKKVNMVITKDQSRLSRNSYEAGYLMDYFFPKNGVRYIALNDGTDTMKDNDMAAMKNAMNEMYSKDISKKVHCSYQLHAAQGKYTGVVPPYGYKKDPNEKGHLIIDEETADIVKMLFEYALDGHGAGWIRRRLEEQKIKCPTCYNREQGYRDHYTKWELQDSENGKYIWDESIINRILKNPVYIGVIASQKTEYRFKVGIIRKKTQNEWIMVPDMHDALVSEDDFNIVQEKLQSRKVASWKNGESSMYAGLIKCGECGKALTFRGHRDRDPKDKYCCKTYTQFGKNHCTQHRIYEDQLNEIILEAIRKAAREALADKDAIANELESKIADGLQAEKTAYDNQILKAKDRLKVLERVLSKLYEDLIEGRITEATFNSMVAKTSSEQEELTNFIKTTPDPVVVPQDYAEQKRKFRELIKEFSDIKELNAEILNRLIRTITVHENILEDGTRDISLDIHFNFKPINGADNSVSLAS